MRKILLTLSLLSSFFCVNIEALADTAYGFENNNISETGFPTSTGDGSRSISSTEHRTGSYSLEQNNNNTSAKTVKVQNLPATFKGGKQYVHYICYIKKTTNNSITLKTHQLYNGSAFASVSPNSAITTSWQRITGYGQKTGNTSDYTSTELRITTQTATTGDKVYLDDIVVYVTSDNVATDLTKPTSATSASATTSSITWTNGTDANTGIQNTLILRRTSGESDDLALNDQGLYAVSATDQSGHWTVVSNSVTSAATSYSGTFSAGDRYAIVHRDLAYNYSTPTYVTITSASCSTPAVPTAVTASSTTSSGTTLTITDAANAASYDIYYSTSSTAPVAGTAANTTSTSKTKALTGLTASTTYYVWVRSVCDSDHKSTWTALNGSSFTTLCTSHTVTAATNNDSYGTADAASTTVCEGSTTTVTAAPKSGYSFVSWAVSGTGSSLSSTSTNPTTLTMGTANATVTATFGCATPSAPSALAASSTTSSGTTLTITDAANTNNYEIYYSTSSTAPEAGTSATATSTSKTKALTSLSASTTYYVWVRSVCDSTHKSSWTALTGSTFTTDAACTDPELTITLN